MLEPEEVARARNHDATTGRKGTAVFAVRRDEIDLPGFLGAGELGLVGALEARPEARCVEFRTVVGAERRELVYVRVSVVEAVASVVRDGVVDVARAFSALDWVDEAERVVGCFGVFLGGQDVVGSERELHGRFRLAGVHVGWKIDIEIEARIRRKLVVEFGR
jgi:hypothetical protein